LLTEDYYVFNKLAKGLIGTNNIDTNSRLCMSSAVAGYKQTLGADAPPCCYEDIALADCLLIAGANPAVAHPIVFRRIEDARAANPELRIIVIDPRRSETAALADLHLALKPGTDIALYNGLLNVLLGEELVDRDYIAAHTEGFDELEAIVAAYPPAAVAEICGLAEADIIQAARWFGTAGAALSLYCQGLNQSSHGTHNNAALIHLHLATGQIGRPGAGPFSLTGQPNAMGGREVGGLANLLSAHRDLANPKHRDEVASLWGLPVGSRSARQGRGRTLCRTQARRDQGGLDRLHQSCAIAARPGRSTRRAAGRRFRRPAGSLRQYRHRRLRRPAVAGYHLGGKGRNGHQLRALHHAPDAGACPARRGAPRLGNRRRLRASSRRPPRSAADRQLFPYTNAEAIFNEHRESTRGRDLDITGLSYALLDAAGPQQWPMPEGASHGRQRLYEDGVFATPSGRARFVQVEHQPTAESTDAARPISLLSGRLRDQWHGMSRTGSVARLFNLDDEPLLSMHPDDLRQRGLVGGDLAQVDSARGEVIMRVKSDAGLTARTRLAADALGQPVHEQRRRQRAHHLGTRPFSQQPELKHAAVAVSKAELPWQLVVPAQGREAANWPRSPCSPGRARCSASSPLPASDSTVASEPLVIFRAAHPQALPESRLQEIDSLFGLGDEAAAIVYADQRRQISKRALAPEGKLIGIRLAGETQAEVCSRR
jgi:assimilatory nitrate reductase catalytic subunit